MEHTPRINSPRRGNKYSRVRATSKPCSKGGGVDHQPKRFAGRANKRALRLPAPTNGEVLAARQRANLSQGEACDLTAIAEVATWSKYEPGKGRDEHALSKIPPLVWEMMMLKTGQHPAMLLVPRMGVPLPRMDAAQQRQRRPRTLPADAVKFVLEHRVPPPTPADVPEPWQPIVGHRFTALTGACVAMDALVKALSLGMLRVSRYVKGEFDCVVTDPSDGEACLVGSDQE